MPKGHTGPSAPGVQDRLKHPKLVGADVYVVRLVNDQAHWKPDEQHRGQKSLKNETTGGDNPGTYATSSGPTPLTGSLYDELTLKAKAKDPPSIELDATKDSRIVAESRPCYRCVSYMHSVGIKRVFWTTSDGTWEGAKVRDLMDQLEGSMASSDPSLGLPIPDVFVTKHEVLLIRRLMASGGGGE